TLVALVLLMSRSSRPSSHTSRETLQAPRHDGQGPSRGPLLVLQSVSFALFLTLGSVSQTLVPIIGADELGLGTAAIGLALGVGGLARVVGTFVWGGLSDRACPKGALV